MDMVRVLIVDDSQLVREILKDIFQADPEINVIGEAVNGLEAIEKTRRLKPDLITMDIQMPEMDGFEATEQIMAYTPTPILIFSSAIDKTEQYTSFKAISLGALDNMSKPDITQEGFEHIAETLRKKVKMLSHIRVIPHIRGKFKARTPNDLGAALKATDSGLTKAAGSPEDQLIRQYLRPRKGPGEERGQKYSHIAVGASTGGPMALQKFFSAFPAAFPCGFTCVQHISKGFIQSFVDWLDSQAQLRVKLAVNGERVAPGTVYFAPDDVQMTITVDNTIQLNALTPPWGEFKPAVNHLFKSVGENLKHRAIGVILTGMGSDGAEGMKIMRDNGAYTIAQDKETSLIFGMPKASIDHNGVQAILPLERISETISEILKEQE